MIKAFLSHSSLDKNDYVKKVASKLGKENISYDEMTFEGGEKTLDEILKGINKTDIFVLFLSENSLNSEWVRREITLAKSKLDSEDIFKIYPIVIDESITHEDTRIPQWLKDGYNLRPTMRSEVSSRRIMSKLRELSWSKHPELKKEKTYLLVEMTN